MTNFWDLKKNEERAELYLYGEIASTVDWGDEITPQAMKEALDELNGRPLDIYINSGGGEVFAGQAIYTILKRYSGRKTVHIDGIAASIASVIAMAGDHIVMPNNAMMMIHKAWSICVGNSENMAKMANDLVKLDSVIAGVYAEKTGKETDEIQAMMTDETWFTAAEAAEYGLIDEIEADKAIAASMTGDILTINGQQVDMTHYLHTDKLRNMVPETEPEPEPTEEPINGEETQPVEDAANVLDIQRSQFRALRRKILDTTID